jgi:hypothetical protein
VTVFFDLASGLILFVETQWRLVPYISGEAPLQENAKLQFQIPIYFNTVKFKHQGFQNE